MSSTVTLNPQIDSKMSRTVTNDGAGQYSVPYGAFKREGPRFNATSTPPVSDAAAGNVTPGSGTSTLNLAAIADEATGVTRDFTGLKVVWCMFTCPSDNGAVVKVKKGASNGYSLQADEEINVYPGGCVAIVLNDGLTDVAAGARTLDVVGTDAGDSLNYEFAVG
jgi:hypothetical protein